MNCFLMGFCGDKKLKKQNNCCSNSNDTCHCKDENLFSPLKSKMKVLKKIKRRMGLGLYLLLIQIILLFCSFDLNRLWNYWNWELRKFDFECCAKCKSTMRLPLLFGQLFVGCDRKEIKKKCRKRKEK